jgi:hypothetical protein
MIEKGYYVHKRTGAKILLVESFAYLGDDTKWESITMWHALAKGGRWKYIKESTVEKFYVRAENQTHR